MVCKVLSPWSSLNKLYFLLLDFLFMAEKYSAQFENPFFSFRVSDYLSFFSFFLSVFLPLFLFLS